MNLDGVLHTRLEHYNVSWLLEMKKLELLCVSCVVEKVHNPSLHSLCGS